MVQKKKKNKMCLSDEQINQIILDCIMKYNPKLLDLKEVQSWQKESEK